MKRSGLILLAVFLSFITDAQLRVAIIGGGHSSSVNETNTLPGWDSTSHNYSSRTGVHFGFMADLQVAHGSKLYFQPGIIFYNKGRKYAAPYDSTGSIKSFSSSQFINYIDVPFNLVLKFPLGKSKF